MFTQKELKPVLIIIFVSIVVILPLAVFGIPDANDMPQHVIFASELKESIANGDLLPNWGASENAGYGSPGIRIYPILGYFPMALSYLLTGSWFDAIWLSFFFWLAISGLGLYRLARIWLPQTAALTASLVYLLIPYHLNQIYITFAYAEFVAAAILPFCFAYAYICVRRSKHTDVLLLVLFLSLLVLSHIPMLLVGSFGLFIFVLAILDYKNPLPGIAKCAAAVACTLALTSFYWVKVLTEMEWINHSQIQYSSGHYQYSSNFFPLMVSSVRKGFLETSFDIGTSVTLLVLTVGALGLMYAKRRFPNAEIREPWAFFSIGLFAFFMSSFLSTPIWDAISPLQKIQFPFRWMVIGAISTAILTGYLAQLLIDSEAFKNRFISPLLQSIALIFLIFVVFAYFLPSSFAPLTREKIHQQLKYIETQQSFFCWWAIWSSPKALGKHELLTAKNREAIVTKWRPTFRTFSVDAGNAENVRVATFYYPNWKANVNGKPVELTYGVDGAIEVPIPPEFSVVQLTFEPSHLESFANTVSVAMLILLVLAGFYSFRQEDTKQ
ncbi:MAG: 6-pyruvoyl-tetrahydropterin synthase-related protein [Pyrinomonadaceae bacterium]